MALGRKSDDGSFVRDIEADYLAAQIAEYETYTAAGEVSRAAAVAVELRQRGYEVDKTPVGVKERAVSPEPLETAVDTEAPAPKRRGRPKKVAEPAPESE